MVLAMVERRFTLGTDEVILPRGTRVVTRTFTVDAAGERHRPGVHCVVREVRGRVYTVETIAGAVLEVGRDQITVEKEDALAALGLRQWDYARLRAQVIHAAVVGSQAWGLADEHSDVDIRGCFLLPFEDAASLFDAPDEIHDDTAQEAYWELAKLLRQALRADPNTLETLWSPLVREQTPLGRRLVDERAIFSSMHVLGSFGRYAQSQLKKLERSLARRAALVALLDDVAAGRVDSEAAARRRLPPDEDLHALVRSLFDRGLLSAASFAALVDAVATLGAARLVPEEVRPKNAYNLVRLLHSCVHWLTHGTPLITVTEPLKSELVAIKRGQVSLEHTLARAAEVAGVVDEAARSCRCLPESPDFGAADALLREARRLSARVALAMPGGATPLAAPGSTGQVPGPAPAAQLFSWRFFPAPLPLDVDVGGLRRFLEAHLPRAPGPLLFLGLTGAHAYGFPSPDSDLDLKAVHAVGAARLLGLGAAPPPLELVVDDWEGREMDLSSHELGLCAELLLKGNGNMLERLLGPLPVVTTALGERLAEVARRCLSRRAVHHYRGFLGAMLREHELDVRERGGARAKRLLYAYRVAFTGAHLLLSGELVTDVATLAPRFGYAERVRALIERKRAAEGAVLPPEEVAPFLEDVPRLYALLDDAQARSILPEAPADEGVAALDALLVEARLAAQDLAREM